MNLRKRKADNLLVVTLLLIAIAVAASVLTFSWVMSMVGSQSRQAQTQLRIDNVDWGVAPYTTITVTLRNTGSVAATIESVVMRENKADASFVALIPDAANPNSLHAGDVKPYLFTLNTIPSLSTSYVIRVTTTTGFFYEWVITTPPS